MQGLVDFASQIGEVFAVLLPTFAYLAALGCFLFAAWGFWMQAQPHNPFRGRPWIPFVSLVLAGAFASFDKILSMALASGGSSLSASITSLSSYSPPSVSDTSSLMGSTPERDARQRRDAVSGVLSEFRGDVRLLRPSLLARGDQRPRQPKSDGLRGAVRVRDHADQHSRDRQCADRDVCRLKNFLKPPFFPVVVRAAGDEPWLRGEGGTRSTLVVQTLEQTRDTSFVHQP